MPRSRTPGSLMLRGSVLKLRRACGKPNCRCAQGEPHESWVLSYSVKGRTRMLPVPESEVTAIREALTGHRVAVRSLETQAMAGIERLRRLFALKKGGKR